MVVAPRYTPPRTLARQVAGTATDAPLITPPLLPPDRRPGTNISITVDLDSGIPVKEINSISHYIVKVEYSPTHYLIQLANPMEIPHKDFILEYKIADEKPQAALVQGVNEKGDGYFLLMATPPAASEIEDLSPKEMILIIDRSGSMGGEKIIQAKKKALGICLEGLNPQDSFNIIKFDHSFDSMSANSLPVTKETLAAGQGFIDAIQVRGGTEMLEPLSHALKQPKQQGRVRVIVFFTDGQVGNQLEILQEVKKNLGESRIFTFGIDTAVNEYFKETGAVGARHGRISATRSERYRADCRALPEARLFAYLHGSGDRLGWYECLRCLSIFPRISSSISPLSLPVDTARAAYR